MVLLRALQERRLIETERGRIAIGWLIVEDLVMVLALVLLPALASALAGQGDVRSVDPVVARLGLGVPGVLALTFAKIAAFVAFMLLVGRRVIPWTLHAIAHTGSRELFRLAVLAIALCVAFGAAKLFGVSLALGAPEPRIARRFGCSAGTSSSALALTIALPPGGAAPR